MLNVARDTFLNLKHLSVSPIRLISKNAVIDAMTRSYMRLLRSSTLKSATTKNLLKSLSSSSNSKLHSKLLRRLIFLKFGKKFASLVLEQRNSELLISVVLKLSFFPIISKILLSTTRSLGSMRNSFFFLNKV